MICDSDSGSNYPMRGRRQKSGYSGHQSCPAISIIMMTSQQPSSNGMLTDTSEE